MIKKIETMVSGLGEISIDALSTWFPKHNKNDLINEISKSEVVEIIGNIVTKKKSNNPVNLNNNIDKDQSLEKSKNKISIKVEDSIDIEAKNIKLQEEKPRMKVLEEKNDFSVEEVNSVPVEEKKDFSINEIALKDIEELVAKYNKSVQAECKERNTLNYEKKLKAIQKYYEERFNIKKIDKTLDMGGELFSLLHKTKGIQVAYLYVSESLDQKTIDYLSEVYKYETMYFCPLNNNSEIKMPMAEFYLKDTNQIIDKYKEVAKISKRTLEILEIE